MAAPIDGHKKEARHQRELIRAMTSNESKQIMTLPSNQYNPPLAEGITPFSFEGCAVRTIQIDNRPWFVTADVLAALGLDRKALGRLDDDERGVCSIHTPGGMQEMTIASESGLYALTLGSRKHSTKRFKRWVTGEVLPTIRKTGSYGAQAAPVIPQSLSAALRLAADQADQIEAQQAQLAIAAPKAEALDLIANADGMLNLQAAGKTLQQQPNKFIAWLRENGWIYKRPGSVSNSARAEKFNAGYLATKSHVVILPDGSERVRDQVMVTPKGLAKLAGVFSGGGAA